jgi:GH15 family glucan-1,4-alpha-glucosidase
LTSPAGPERIDGYAPIRDYAALGDGRTTALVARDGSIDWLCLPDADSGSVFGRLLDAERGGGFQLAPTEPFETVRAYRRDSNVLETTFRCASGAVRVTDALALADRSIRSPMRQLVRRVVGLSGTVRLCWCVEPRFDFAARTGRLERRHGHPVVTSRDQALAICSWGAGEPRADDGDGGATVAGEFVVDAGGRALLTVAGAHREPLVFVGRDDAEAALDRTDAFWRRWSGRISYRGPWRDAVVRSALVLKLLIYSPSGAIIAAPTTSLPEVIGGIRNWDYRFTWVRDATWTIDSLLRLGFRDEARAFLWWLMHASRQTQPRLSVLYRIDGSRHATEEDRPLAGYRGSRPVRIGNGAIGQVQLDIYGALLDAVWRYVSVSDVGRIDKDTGDQVASIADYVARTWRNEDSGIWEARGVPAHYTQSKALCWLALERASRLAELGAIPDRRERWQPAAAELRAFLEQECWDDELASYVRAPTLRELDASLLTLSILGCEDPRSERMVATVDAVIRELGRGPLVYRYRGDDGVPQTRQEGAFVACSFWLVSALAGAGRTDEARERMAQLLELANDVGLYAEEIDPATGAFLGNFPQGLSHLALVNAALALAADEAGEAGEAGS